MPDRPLSELALEFALRTLWALLTTVLAILLARALRAVTMRALQRHKAASNAIILLGNLAQIAVLTVGALVILGIYTGPNFVGILASFGIVGLVIGLSLQDILKNFLAGIWILVERPFRIGDTIELGQRTGSVEQIAFRTTMLRTPDGRQVVVPNSLLMTEVVTNHTAYPLRRGGLWLVLPGEHLPEDPVAKVREALRNVPAVAEDPPPAVELRSASDGQLRFFVSFWTPDEVSARPEALTAVRTRFPQAEVHDA